MKLSSLSHLRNLTIHTEIFFQYGEDDTDSDDEIFISNFFRYTCKILKTAPSLEQLTIEVFVDLSHFGSRLESVDLSLLGLLIEPSICFHHLDIYMYTGSPHIPVTHAQMRSSLKEQEGLLKLIEQGVLVLHPEEAAPTMSRVYTLRESKPCIIM